MQCKGYLLSKKEAYIKKNKLTNELRKIYLDKKNFNTNPNKKSRALYAEAVNELYNTQSLNKNDLCIISNRFFIMFIQIYIF